MVLDIFALVVMAVLVIFVIFLVVKLGPLPGKIANKRGHPQTDAIKVLGWISVITFGLAWPLALNRGQLQPEQHSTDSTG